MTLTSIERFDFVERFDLRFGGKILPRGIDLAGDYDVRWRGIEDIGGKTQT